MSCVHEQYDDVWRTRTEVQMLEATPSCLKPDGDDVEVRERDGLRRQDAERASRHMQTNTWYDVKHVDLRQRAECIVNRRQFQKEQRMVRAKRILCVIEKESQLRHPNHRVNLHRPRPRTHL